MKGVFEIDLTGVTPKVSLDSFEMTNVAEVRVGQAHGEFPKVIVAFDAHQVKIAGQGEVTLQSTANGPTPTEFLASIDIDTIAAEAMSNMTYGQSPMAVLIELIKERANAAS